MGKFIDLTGQKFCRLTVIGRAEDNYTSGGNKKIMWNCKCDCGNEIIVSGTDLRNGHTKSCGCWNKEMAAKRMTEMRRKYNKYDLNGDYGIGYTSKGEKFYFDLEDYDKIKDYCWHFHYSGYIYSNEKGTGKHVTLHRLIMNCTDNDYDVDHEDHDLSDCRKINLRKCNRSENCKNRGLMKNNTSGVSGVWWHTRDSIWEVSININKKRVYIGRFDNFEEAVKARKSAEEKYYKEYSYDNSMKEAEAFKIEEEND